MNLHKKKYILKKSEICGFTVKGRSEWGACFHPQTVDKIDISSTVTGKRTKNSFCTLTLVNTFILHAQFPGARWRQTAPLAAALFLFVPRTFTCQHQHLMKEAWNSNMLISHWLAKHCTAPPPNSETVSHAHTHTHTHGSSSSLPLVYIICTWRPVSLYWCPLTLRRNVIQKQNDQPSR